VTPLPGHRVGVVVVVARGERFLLIRRAEGILAAGAWCFVGGGVEPGEDPHDAVIREFHEEVGGRVRPLRKVWEYLRPDGMLLLHWWLAELLEDSLLPNPSEVAEIRWCTAAEIDALENVLESNRQFLASLGRELLDGGA
jgi:8-oxo-dGTP diphosphatase